jgi:hypothetical protein
MTSAASARRPRKGRRSPRQTCQLTFAAYFGYGTAEDYPCGSPATHKAWAAARGGSHDRVRMCTHHARLWPAYTGPDDKPAYRYRTIRQETTR